VELVQEGVEFSLHFLALFLCLGHLLVSPAADAETENDLQDKDHEKGH